MHECNAQPDRDSEPRRQGDRSSRRRPCQKDSAVRLMQRSKYQRHDALVHDVSPRGLGLLLDCKLERGMVVAILLQNDLAQASDIVSARVSHVTAQADGRWLVGCSLSRSLSDGEIAKLLKSEVSAYAAAAGGPG